MRERERYTYISPNQRQAYMRGWLAQNSVVACLVVAFSHMHGSLNLSMPRFFDKLPLPRFVDKLNVYTLIYIYIYIIMIYNIDALNDCIVFCNGRVIGWPILYFGQIFHIFLIFKSDLLVLFCDLLDFVIS